MSGLDKNIFKRKKFSDLLSEIYDNQKKRDDQVSILISQLKPLIKDVGDATLVVPLIKEYLEVGIKNDEHLIKMATVIQRVLNSDKTGDAGSSGELTEKEKQELLNIANELGKDTNNDKK